MAIIAKDRQQAKVILGYIAGFIRSITLFAELIEDELAETIRLSNGVVIEVHTASIGAPRGRTFLAVLCDETAFWPTEGDSANVDAEIINAVRPGCRRSVTACFSLRPRRAFWFGRARLRR